MSLLWLLVRSNPWRAACVALLLLVGVEHIRANHWRGEYQAKVAETALAADANKASQKAVRLLQADLATCNTERAAYARNLEAVQAARAKQAAADAAKLKRAQKALDAALEAHKDWAATPVPSEVRKALSR